MWERIKAFGELCAAIQGAQWAWAAFSGGIMTFLGLLLKDATAVHYALLFLSGALVTLAFSIWRNELKIPSFDTHRSGSVYCYFHLYRINGRPHGAQGEYQLAITATSVIESINYWISPWGVEPNGSSNDPYYSIDKQKPLIQILHEGGRAWERTLPLGNYRIDFNTKQGNWYEHLRIFESDGVVKESIVVTTAIGDAGALLFKKEPI